MRRPRLKTEVFKDEAWVRVVRRCKGRMMASTALDLLGGHNRQWTHLLRNARHMSFRGTLTFEVGAMPVCRAGHVPALTSLSKVSPRRSTRFLKSAQITGSWERGLRAAVVATRAAAAAAAVRVKMPLAREAVRALSDSRSC